jgi:mono/diheme cytochrome c family protein
MGLTRRVIGAFVITACATLAAQQTPARSTASGVYSAEQASAGEKIYFEKCASCHGADLGGIERAPALTGGQFFDAWQGQDLRRLRERLDTMPPAAPRSLSDADASAVIAFVLRSSDMPAGRVALSTDRGQLAGITFGRSTAGPSGAPGAAFATAPSRPASTTPTTAGSK